MTPVHSRQGVGEAVERDFVLIKRGLFYRPNAMGYTGIKEHAGRYSQADAEIHADRASGVTAMPFEEAPLIAPKFFDDVAVKYLLGCIDSRDAVLSAQAAALSSQAEALEAAVTACMWSEKALERYDDALGLNVDEAALIAWAKCGEVIQEHEARTALSPYRQTKEDTA